MKVIKNDCYAIRSVNISSVFHYIGDDAVKKELLNFHMHTVKFKKPGHKWSIKY